MASNPLEGWTEKEILKTISRVYPNIKVTPENIGDLFEKAIKERPVSEGGSGSGNFGHEGRPGQVGGSSEGLGAPRNPSGGKFTRRDITLNGEVHGYISYQVRGNKLHINEIYMDEELRGKGIGSRAVKTLMKDTKTSVLDETVLTQAGRALFSKLEKEGVKVLWRPQEADIESIDQSFGVSVIEKSGNFGHAGIPGHQGGSAPSGEEPDWLKQMGGSTNQPRRSLSLDDLKANIKPYIKSIGGKDIQQRTGLTMRGVFFSCPKAKVDEAVAHLRKDLADTQWTDITSSPDTYDWSRVYISRPWTKEEEWVAGLGSR